MVRHLSNYFVRTRTLTRDLALGLVIIMALVLSSVGFFIYTVGEREAENTLRFQSEDTARDLQSILEPYLVRSDLAGARAVLQAYASQDRILRARVIDESSRVILSEGPAGDPENGLRIGLPVELAAGQDGRIQLLFSREVVRERKDRVLYTIAVVAGFVLLSLLFSTRILLQRLLQTPLDELRRGVQRISAGNYGRILPPVRQQDLQRMVRSVNQMARSIQRRDQSIKDYAAQLEQTNDQLERKLVDLNLARMRIESSEQKYKHLVESSNEVVFSLDASGVFLTVNQAVGKQLGLRPARIIGTRFEDHLYSFDEKSAFLTRDRFSGADEPPDRDPRVREFSDRAVHSAGRAARAGRAPGIYSPGRQLYDLRQSGQRGRRRARAPSGPRGPPLRNRKLSDRGGRAGQFHYRGAGQVLR